MRLFIFSVALLVTINAHAQSITMEHGEMTTPTCESYPEWMTKNISDIDLSILGDRPHRVLKPDSMATMDYSPDRLNIHTTEDGVILGQDCG